MAPIRGGELIRKYPVRQTAVTSLLAALLSLPADAKAELPQGAQIVRGNISINSNAQSMTVRQPGGLGIVNWNSFSIGGGSTVRFENGSGATLNRVTGVSPSRIDGTLSATGSLYLLNRNGVIIGSNGKVLTGGDFIASTRDISDDDFLNGGGFTLFGDSPAGVTNLGKITSSGGDVMLAGYTATNSGDITARAGRVGLAAGDRIDVLADAGWLNGAYAVSLGSRGQDVTNEGRIRSLVAELRTHNGNIYALTGNNTGLIQATGVRNEGGKVFLTADQGTIQSSGKISATRGKNGGDIELTAAAIENFGGTQNVSGAFGGTIKLTADSIVTDTEMLARGTSGSGGSVKLSATGEILFTSAGVLDVSGKTGGGTASLFSGPGSNLLSGAITAASSYGLGGTINLLGESVSLFGATVDASGATGGGVIHVGGGYQGATIAGQANSSRTYVSDKTTLRADATGARGEGGTVVVWADGTTEFAGKVSARSGTRFGDGGTVETSGLAGLGVSGTVDASARGTTGANGRWLLDPKNITIGTVTDVISEFQSLVEDVGGYPADNVSYTSFGSSIDISGTTAVIGTAATSSSPHAAYVFENGKIAARLTSPDTNNTYRLFGGGVQIEGDYVAVMDAGARHLTGNYGYNPVTGVYGEIVYTGSVYLFRKGTRWRNGTVNLISTLHSVNQESYFGYTGTFSNSQWGMPDPSTGFNNRFAMYQSQPGLLTIAVGDPLNDWGTGTNTGGVFGYTFSTSYPPSGTQGIGSFLIGPNFVGETNELGIGTYLTAENGYLFAGTSTATSRSNDLFVHNPNYNSGAPALFSNFFSNNGRPSRLTAEDNKLFYVTQSGLPFYTDFYVGGNGSAYNDPIYINRYPTQIGINLTAFGGAIANLAVDGDTLMVSDGGSYTNNGRVSFFTKPAETAWNGYSIYAPLNPTYSYVFPANIVVSNYQFAGVSMAIEGDYALAGIPGYAVNDSVRVRGAVAQFRRSGGAWSFTENLAPAQRYEGSTYGSSLDLDGDTWVIGDQYYGDQNNVTHGRVYVYENGQLSATLKGGNDLNSLGLGLGMNVAISGNNIVATGASYTNGRVGNRLHLFEKGAAWRNGSSNLTSSVFDDAAQQSVNATQITSLALDGNTIAFGRPVNSGNYSDAKGKVSIYQFTPGFLYNVATYTSPINTGTDRDFFGASVALSGNTLAVGAVVADASSFTIPEYIHLYEKTGSNWTGITPVSISVATLTGDVASERNLGASLALDGNTLVAGYRRPGNAPVYVFERDGTWAASTTPVAKLTGSVSGGYFGGFVAIDGDNIAVTGYNNINNNALAFVYQKQGDWRDGTANLVATFSTPKASSYYATGPIAIDGDTVLLSGQTPIGSPTSFATPVSVFKGPYDFSGRVTFASGPGDNLAISAASLTASLSLGTDITLQANNDITVSQAINVNNPFGDGGDLTLLAGRRILVNASIFTDNGDLTLVANAPGANTSYRDAGERVVVLGRDASNASVTLTLGTGDLVIAAADRFENRTGSTNPFRFDAINPGRWLVYSTTPNQTGAPDIANLQADLATAGRDWVYYNKAFNLADPAPSSLPAGDGFLYSVQPSIAVSVGNASLTYGQAFAGASLTLGSVTLGGSSVAASTYGLTLDSAALANLVDVSLAPSVTFSTTGFANAGTYTGGITAAAKPSVTSGAVYGVAVTTSGAGTLTVAKKTLDARPADATRVYRDANPTFTVNYTGFVAGENISVLDTPMTVSTAAALASPVGNYALTATGGLDNNYVFNVTGPGQLSVTRRELLLTGLVALDRVYDATDIAPLSGTATVAPLGGDQVVLATGVERVAHFADKNIGADKAVTTFTGFSLTGAQANNYTLVLPTNLVADVTRATINIDSLYLAAADRDYDGTTAATLTGTSSSPGGLVHVTPLLSDNLTVSGTPVATFADKNAGVAKTVSISGLTLGGLDAGNYILDAKLAATIRPLDLAVSGLAALDRVYDASTGATLSGVATISPVAGDSISLVTAGLAAAFADRHVGTDKAVTISGLALTGADAANYTLRQPSGLVADITPASLFVTGISAASRVYDATTAASLIGSATVAPIGADSVTLVASNAAAVFADKNVGLAKAVTVSGFTLSGADAGNYLVVQPAGLFADITTRPISISGLAVNNKAYDATTAATATGTAVFGGIITGDDASIDGTGFGFVFADKNAGLAKAVTLSGLAISGADAANYDITRAAGFTADIAPAPLSVGGVAAVDRGYDSTANVAVSGGVLLGVIGSDDIVFSSSAAVGALADKNAGANRAVTVSGFSVSGADASNYLLAQPTGLTVNISRAALNLVGLSADKTYDGTASAPLTASGLDAVFSGDLVSPDFSAVTAAYADKNAGANRSVSLSGLFGLSGADAANYTLAQPASLAGTIARRGITVSGLTIADKTYDGTRDGVISGTGTFGGTLAGDDLAIDVGAIDVTFADANAGVNKTVALSGVTLSGADAGNYTAGTPTGITATIFPKDLTISGLSANDRVYDRTSVASLAGTGALSGFVAGETVLLDESFRAAAFADKNVGADKSVTVSGLSLVSTATGAASNYRIVAPSLFADITPAFVDVTGLSALGRVYDATRVASLAGVAALDFGALNGVLSSSENVSIAGVATGLFADKNASLSPKAVTVSGLSLAGADAGNYVLRQQAGLAANVSPANLVVTGASVAGKTYDATRDASLLSFGAIAPLGADSVTLLTDSVVALFDTKNVGAAKPVATAGYALAGPDAANYRVVAPAGLAADITPADLLVGGLSALDRFYDRTAVAQLSGVATITPLGADSVNLAGTASAAFFDKSAGQDRNVRVAGLSLTGAEAANYRLVVPTLTADIVPRFVTIGGLVVTDRTYDGTTAATLAGDATLDGLLAGDDLSFDRDALDAAFADKNVGLDKAVSISGYGLRGADAANYAQVLPFDLVADIAAKELSVIGADAIDRVYDRTRLVALQGGALLGAVASDAVNLVTSFATGTIADKNAQLTPKAVTATGYAISGADAANYTLLQPTGIDVVISQRPVDIAGVQVADKLFDGLTTATISGGTLTNGVLGDDLALVTTAAAARFETPDIANDKIVLLSGFVLSGADAANYVLNPSPRATGRILPALKNIVDVVPAEVLRASANASLEQRRASLADAANARADQVKLTDYNAFSDQVSAGLVIARPVYAIYNTPLEQQDDVTRAYIAAANAAQAASRRAEDIVMGYRTTAIAYKETGQQLNQTIRDLSVERDLRATRVAQLDQVNAQIAQADKNLAAIQDAKNNIVLFTQKIAEANRLGRGSEVAEYERILASARAIVATEADTRAKRDALAKESESAAARLAAGEKKIADFEASQAKLETTLVAQKETLESTRAQSADAKAAAAAANEKLLAAQAAGAAAYADASTTLVQADSLRALAASDTPAKTAAAMAEGDPFVKQFEAKAAVAAQVTDTLGKGLSSSLSSAALDYAKSVADKINSGGLLDDSATMRDSLVKSVPALQALQTQLDAAEQRQAQETAAMEARIAETTRLRAAAMSVFGMKLTPEQIAADAAQERARLNDRLNQLTGGALDLSKVPTTNASGEALTELERISIAILNKQLNTPSGAASEVGTFASGYKDRLNDAVAEEFGFSPEQALNDPRVLARETAARIPLNADGSLDKEQLADNLKVAASAYVNLNGALKDEAIQQAATQDPTGAAQAYVGAEKAARAEFVKTYGGQPEEVITERINARIDAYKNADSPEALMRVHAATMVPGGEMTIEQATKAYNDLKSGKSPDAVVKDMATELWNGNGDGPSAREQAAQAARTAQAASDAAISSLEEADKTGLFKASNTITGAAGEEFAKTFGGTPQELGIKALENPADAANQVKNAAKDIFTTPDGALNAVKGGIATYSNMADATLNAAKQQLDVVAEKFGGPGKAAAFIAKHGITAATEVKDFLQDGLSTVTGGLVPKSGPSKAEVEAAIAYAKAEEEVARAESQKREDAMLLQYFAAAQQLAQKKAEMAAGVVNAKAQVGQYLVAAQAQAKQEQTAAVAKQVVTAEFTRVVQDGLNEKAAAAQSQVAAKLTTEQMQAKAALWASAR